MKMSHMTADTLEELHAMAERLGLRKWFQNKTTPHYDLCKSKREEAIKLGAISETATEGAIRRLKAKGWMRSYTICDQDQSTGRA
jgi:hypothetical protein